MAAQRRRLESLGRSWRQGRPRGGPSVPKEPNGDARQTLRTVSFRGHERPLGRHVDKSLLQLKYLGRADADLC